MVVYLPCKLGEGFERLKFQTWENGRRVYRSDGEATLNGFSIFECQTRCLSIPIIFPSRGGFLSYDPLGEFSQEYQPRYKLYLSTTPFKLYDKGFPGSRTVHLGGLVWKDGIILADLITKDRYEHLRYPIKDSFLRYTSLDDVVSESYIQYVTYEPSEIVEGVSEDFFFDGTEKFVQESIEGFLKH